MRAMMSITLLLAARGATLASRLSLLIVLAWLFPPIEMAEVAGAYVLSAAVAGIAGLELHRDVGRRYVMASPGERAVLLRDHFLLLTLCAVIAGACIWPLSRLNLLSTSNAWVVGAIVALLVINADTTRFFLLRSLPLAANLHLFVATGAWTFAFAPLAYAFPDLRTAHWAFSFWLLSLLAGLLFIPALIERGDYRIMLSAKLQSQAFMTNASLAVTPFIAAAAMTLANSADRLVLRALDQPNALNLVFFHVGVLQVTSIVVDVLIYQRIYPRLIRISRRPALFHYALRRLTRSAALIASVLAPVLGMLSLWMSRNFRNVTDADDSMIVAILVLAFVLDAIVAQLINAAYAFGLDRPIRSGSLVDLIFTLIAGFALIGSFGALGAAILWLGRGVVRIAWYWTVLSRATKRQGLREEPSICAG